MTVAAVDRNSFPQTPPRLPDRDKAVLIALGNLFLLVLVAITFRSQSRVGWGTYIVFAVIAGFTVITYFVPVFLPAVWRRIIGAVNGAVKVIADDPPDEDTSDNNDDSVADQPAEANSIPIVPWVILNFIAVGWLVYRTGGAVTSPYSQIPLMMVVFGQLLTDLHSEPQAVTNIKTARDLFRLCWYGLRAFRTTLLLGALFYAGVTTAEGLTPTHVGAPPDVTVALVTALNVFVATLVNYITRQRRAKAVKDAQSQVPPGEPVLEGEI